MDKIEIAMWRTGERDIHVELNRADAKELGEALLQFADVTGALPKFLLPTKDGAVRVAFVGP